MNSCWCFTLRRLPEGLPRWPGGKVSAWRLGDTGMEPRFAPWSLATVIKCTLAVIQQGAWCKGSVLGLVSPVSV